MRYTWRMFIENKRIMMGLLKQGVFGNTVETWDTPEDVPESKRDREFGIRYHKAGARGFITHLTYDALLKNWTGDKNAYVSESVSAEDLIANIEISRLSSTSPGWYVQIGEAGTHREAMRSGFKTYTGALALKKVHEIIGEYEYLRLMRIFEEYDLYERDLTVELSYLRRAVGFEPSQVVVWEVRHY